LATAPRLFFSAGEASGDAYAAQLARRVVRDWNGPISIEGVGGKRLAAEGGRLVADSSRWGAIGIIESALRAPTIYQGYLAAKKALRTGQPGVCVPIDFGYMNIKLARYAKAQGWKVLYFVPPGSWRKDKQGADMPVVSHEIVTPFSWSAEILTKMGGSAHWFGHPLRQMVAQAEVPEAERRGVALLPGSREHEVTHNLPVLIESVKGLGLIRVSVAANLGETRLRELWKAHGGGEATFHTDLYPMLKSSRAALVCSGTATLESALCGCPTIVVYRGSKAMEIEYKIRRPNIEFISLPNILLGRKVLPELIQWEANPTKIRELLDGLMADPSEQLAAFAELETILGPANALDASAELLLKMLRS